MRSAINRVGKYELRAVLVRMSFSTVYDGWDSDIARRVAIKMMPISALGGGEAGEVFVRFKRGAQAAGQLNHPNIVAVHDYGETQDYAYLVMEFVDGPTLKSLFDDDHRFDLAAICKTVGGVLAALQYSHDRGVVHRDVKPANIMFAKDGGVKITDFGIARLEDSEMTQTGMVIGTPAYMSPEQFLGEKVDLKTDIYSTGVVLYHMLTGERPYEGSLTTIMHKVLYGSPPVPSRLSPLATPGMDAIVTRAMARDPQDRFASAAEFNAALQALLAPISKKPVSPEAFFAKRPYPVRPASAFASRGVVFAALAVSLIAAVGTGAWYSHASRTSPDVVAASQTDLSSAHDDAASPDALEKLTHYRDSYVHPANSATVAPSADPASAAASSPTLASPVASSPALASTVSQSSSFATNRSDRTAASGTEAAQFANVPRPDAGSQVADMSDLPMLPLPPIEPAIKAGSQHGPDLSTASTKKLLTGTGYPRGGVAAGSPRSSGGQAGAARTDPERPAALTDGGTARLLADAADRTNQDAERRESSADDSSAGAVRRLRAELARQTAAQVEATAIAPLYASTSSSSVGLLCQSITAESAARLGLSSAQGMLVTGVTVGSAAAKAGIRQDDVILKIKGSDVRELSALSAAAAGEAVPIEILRHGARQVVQLQVDQPRH